MILLNPRLTGHSENFKIKLYYFQERLSLRYDNPEVSVSVFIYDSIEIKRTKRTCF